MLAAIGLGLATAAAWIALTGNTPDRVGYALGLALAVALPVGVGLFAWDGTHERFARALVALGVFSFVPALSSSSDPVLYSVGRVGNWFSTVAVVWLALGFPSGRLSERGDRLLVGAAIGLILSLYLPTTVLMERFPTPAPWTACTHDCPANAFMVLSSQPGFVDAIVVPLREFLTIALLLAIPVRLGLRIRGATRLTRRTVGPVIVASIVATLALALGYAVRREDPSSPVLGVVLALLMLWLPAVSIGFLLGVVRWRLYVAGALQRLSVGLRDRVGPGELEALAAGVLDDPTAQLAYRDREGTWRDIGGAPIVVRADRHVTEIHDADGAAYAVVHDALPAHERSFVEAVAVYTLIGEENHRRALQAEASLSELAAARASTLAAADTERRRIERDMHDGAQQRLVGLAIRLSLADELIDVDPTQARTTIRALQDEIEATLREVRSVTAGAYPPELTSHGIAPALRALAQTAAIPVQVDVADTERLPAEIEAAVYFCCSEALQNAAKHARGAAASISLARSSAALSFKVCDDGPGFEPAAGAGGQGLKNIRDRVRAVGGTLAIASSPGKGTCVSGRIPLPTAGP